MSNKPVAWMQTFTQVKDGVELVKHAVNIEQVGINDIPLYTHQYERPHNTVLVPCDKLAEMQAEIEALRKSHIELERGIVKDLNQRQSAEPVAWMDYLEHSDVYDLNVSGRGIPLYTHPVDTISYKDLHQMVKNVLAHPVKELALTNEEMISIYEKDWSGIKCGLGRAVEQAILRKASEK